MQEGGYEYVWVHGAIWMKLLPINNLTLEIQEYILQLENTGLICNIHGDLFTIDYNFGIQINKMNGNIKKTQKFEKESKYNDNDNDNENKQKENEKLDNDYKHNENDNENENQEKVNDVILSQIKYPISLKVIPEQRPLEWYEF